MDAFRSGCSVSHANPALFGRMFVVLGILFFVGSLFLVIPASMDSLANNGNADATEVGWLFLAEGVGFTAFGALILKQNWGGDNEAAH